MYSIHYNVMKVLPLAVYGILFCTITRIELSFGNTQPESRQVTFICKNNEVILAEHFCDGIQHCSDNSDEIALDGKLLFNLTSRSVSCINKYNPSKRICSVEQHYVCNGNVNCDGINPCDVYCPTHYTCLDTGNCVKRDTVCDKNHCNGCAEDHEWLNGVGFKCFRNGVDCILPQQLLWDAVSDCDGELDRCYANPRYLENLSVDLRGMNTTLQAELCFKCLDSQMVIPRFRICDGKFDCSDLSDECLCEEGKPTICSHLYKSSKIQFTSITDVEFDYSSFNDFNTYSGSNESNYSGFNDFNMYSGAIDVGSCKLGDIICDNSSCLERRMVCDGKVNCLDKTDERHEYCEGTIPCYEAIKKLEPCRCSDAYNCKRKMGIACNNVAECQYQEDECPNDLQCDTNVSCGYVVYQQRVSGPTMIMCTSSKPVETQFLLFPPRPPPDDDSIYIYKTEINRHHRCDGVLLCDIGREDETNCTNRFMCESNTKGHISIHIDDMCNGIIDCKDGSDETIELCGKERFFCSSLGGNKVNIPNSLICDFQINCDDAEDEINCPDDRFYCENGEPLFVLRKQMLNGVAECSDWSDECPTDEKLRAENPFSSRYHLIGNPLLRVLIWIMGLASLLGNTTVIITESKKLLGKKQSASVTANRIIILNLAMADLLMGCYLIALGLVGLKYKRRYCSQDLNWRSSSGCITLGIVSVISAEGSVMCMVCLTACRLNAVLKPFKAMSSPRKRYVFGMIMVSWIFALGLSLIPLLPNLDHVFVKHALFHNNPFAIDKMMTLNKTKKMLADLLIFDVAPNSTLPPEIELQEFSWNEIQQTAKESLSHPEYLTPTKHFGYYSAHGVCIPKFFVTTDDPSWKFSFVVTLFNFTAFMFVAVSYVAIYSIAVKKNDANRSLKKDSKKNVKAIQRKVLRLIITDFCCWIPICVMAFIKLAGVDIPNSLYAVAAIILLPINSALNPILYSNLLDNFWAYIRNIARKTKKGESPKVVDVTETTRITNT